MRNLSKILCAILVLAVLCSSLLLVASAEEFVPTATVESVTLGSGTITAAFDASSSISTGIGMNFYENNYTGYVITTADGDMLEMVPVTTGAITGNFQFTLQTPATVNVTYDAEKAQYSVYDIDFATESDLLDLWLSPNMRDANASGGGLFGGTNISLRGIVDIDAGVFYHLTIVQDLNNNKQYIFLNNKLINSESLVTSSDNLAKWVAGTSVYNNQYKIQSSASYGNNTCSLVEEQSIIFDNIGFETYAYALGTTSLTEALAAGDLSLWEDNKFDSSYTLPTLPALVKIDGVEYNNVSEANDILYWGVAKEVEILRTPVQPIEINCPATITTNGYSYNTGAAILSAVDNGDGTVTTKAATGSYETIPANEASNYDASIAEVVKYEADDNLFSGIFAKNYGAEGQRANYIYSNSATGNKFIYETVYGGVTPTADSYFEWKMSGGSSSRLLKTGVNQYMTIEFDIAMGDYTDPAAISFNTRIASDSTCSTNTYLGNTSAEYAANASVKSNTLFDLNTVLKGAGVPAGEFAHVTIAAEADTGKAYVFVNGSLEQTFTNAVYSGTIGESCVFIESLRIGQGVGKTNQFYYDNLYIKLVEDESITAAIAAKTIALPEGHVLPALPTLAVVNGVEYTTPETAAIALIGNVNKNAEIMYSHNYSINVNGDAVINTNGFENAIVLADGCTSTQEGNIITVDAPFISSAYYTDATFGESAYKASASGNEIITNTIYNASTSEWKAQYIHNAYTGESIYKISSIADGLPANHIQWNFFMNPEGGVSYDAENPTYAIYEFDFATESEAIALDITANVRTGTSGSGSDKSQNASYLDNTALMLQDVEQFKFHHVAIIMDYNNNVMYTYLDNELVTSCAFIADSTDNPYHTNWVKGTADVLYSGIKLQAHKDYKLNGENVTPLKVGQNLFIANAYGKIYVGGSASNLADALATGDITSWSGNRFNESYNLPNLPILATVDGIECTTVAEIEALCSGSEAKTIEFMRDADATITVSCAAHTVIDNGITTVNVVAEHKGYMVDYAPFTCTENGNIEYYHCDICGKNVETSAIDAYVLSDEELVLQAMGHMRANKVEAVDPTCSENGNIEYWYCNACGLNTTGRAAEAEILPDEALVLLATGHTRATKIEAVPATHTENGTIEYWHCDVCGLNTTGRAAEAEILSDEALVINATGHIRAEHVAAIPATHTENGVSDYWYCADCDLKLESRAPDAEVLTDEMLVLLATGHIRAELVEAVPATHTENGVAAYYYCADCDLKLESRSPDAEVLTDEMLVLLATGHIRAEHVVAVAPTHTAHGNIEYWHCADCGANYTDRTAEAELIPAGEEVVTSMGHQRAEKYDAIPATHTQAGTVEYYYCSVCDACFAGTAYNSDKLITPEDFTILPVGHIRAELVEAIPATHTENGVASYYYCADCDAKFESRNSVTSLTSADLVILAIGHIRAELVAAVPATHTAHGVAEYYYCADCDLKLESRAPDAAVLTDEDLVVLSLGHERAEKHEAIPSTHTETGVREYYYCAVCDQNYDGTAYDAVALTDEELVLLPLGHIRAELIPGTPATHTTAGTIDSYYCADCEASFTGRAPEAKILTSVTEYVVPALGHINGSWIDAIPATHTENGVASYYYCAECDLKLDGEGSEAAVLTDAELVLLATGHVRAEKVEATPATCREAGNIAYWHCAECGANFTGRAPEAELLADSEITILPAHKWSAEYVEVEDGHCRKCTVCEETLSVEEHTMNEDYVCTACGHTEVPTSFFDMLVYYFKQFLEMIANLFSGSKA